MDKVCHVSCQHFLSGIGRYSFELAEEMKKDCSLKLYKPSKSAHIDAMYERKYSWIQGYEYKSFRQFHPIVLPFYINHSLKNESKDQLFHAHWFLSGLALSYKLAKKERFVVTMHDVSLLHVSEGENWYRKYYEWAINRFKKRSIPLIVVSQSAKNDAIQYANYPEELIHVVYNGINFDQFYPLKNINKPNDYFDIIYTGGLGERKNLTLLLDAFKVIEQKYPHVRLKIAGMYPERTIYPSYAESLKLKNVTFEGFIPDNELINFYHSGHLLIFPSLYEGFGFAPLEAMASGVPVLSAKGGSLHEVVGKGGDFFDYNTDSLISKTINIIENESYRENLIRSGNEWVKNFTWKESVLKTQKVYQTI